jgi:hypothetical protein
VDNISDACQILLDDTAAEGRLLLTDSPALGRTGTALHLYVEASDILLPVVLVEPKQTSWATANHGHFYDLRTGIAVKLGLALLTTPATPPTAANWTLHHAERKFMLADPTSASLADFTAPDDPLWLATARQHGRVIAIYGTNIGVRRPISIPHGGWGDRARAAELDQSVSRGAVAWGMVSFIS